MSKICYVSKNFKPDTLAMIEKANDIIASYLAQGYKLTVRQLYYQFVSRDFIANKVSEYKRLASIIDDGRKAGLIDWEAIEDRTRGLESLGTWDDPESILRSAHASFRLDKWADQPHRVEVWVEKEALAGVFQRVCEELEVPFLSCRGYTSQSEMWRASLRLRRYKRAGQEPIILHFGDHDPSGIDMSRDIVDRLQMFRCNLKFERLALNMDQVREHQPPPNPAKEVDPRFAGYLQAYGDESWELDALEPAILSGLVRDHIEENILDKDAWAESSEREAQMKTSIKDCADNWEEVCDFLKEK